MVNIVTWPCFPFNQLVIIFAWNCGPVICAYCVVISVGVYALPFTCTVVYYYKAKKVVTSTKTQQPTQTTQAKNEVATLPKTGNNIISMILLIVGAILLCTAFGLGYIKLKDLK